MDPYSAENFLKFWPVEKPMFNFVAKDATDGSLVVKRGVPSPYPPTAFVVLAPLALTSWKTAEFLWITLSLLAMACVVGVLVSISDTTWRDQKAWLFAAFALALEPFHTGLATQNPVLLVIGLCTASMWAERNSRLILAAILLAIAICLKPQIGLCFLLLFVVRKSWRVASVAGSTALLTSLLAVTRLSIAGSAWLGSYLENSRKIFQPGAINDFTPLNPVWFHMVNLQVVLYPLLGGIRPANLFAVVCGAVLTGLWLWKELRKGSQQPCLLSLSTLAVISLLPVYHRSYDAAVVVFFLAWLILYQQRSDWLVRPGLILMAVFLSPGGVFVEQLAMRAHVPAEVVSSAAWRVLVVSHQTWALLFLAVLLLWSMFRAPVYEAHPVQTEETRELVLQD
jgi:hypothetical protein